ncbi:uncharacterized protein LOC144141796 [Haemaphysalis longicornis]
MHVSMFCVMMTHLLLVALNMDPCSACNRRPPPFGPRLLNAKTLLGNGIRLCEKELLKVVRKVPPEQVAKLLTYGCSRYNACKDSFDEKHGTPVIKITACLIKELEDQRDFLTTKFNLSDSYVPDMILFMECLQKLDAAATNLQTIDDTVTIFRMAIMAYGWT